MRVFLSVAITTAILVCLSLWYLSSPRVLSPQLLSSLPSGDIESGKRVFHASGCASCHGANLAGGEKFPTPFGVFYAPNITPHKTSGIGNWSKSDFANALLRGVSPTQEHYYPSFPYASYTRMESSDVSDLWSYLGTFPALESDVPSHSLSFPFSVRRLVGLWKFLYLDTTPLPPQPTPDLIRGQYLVRVLSHCGECHTPRNFLGAMDHTRFLSGGSSPDGTESIPSITPSALSSWSLEQLEYSLESGFLPNYDTFGSTMSSVQENLSKLSAEDRRSISLYLLRTAD